MNLSVQKAKELLNMDQQSYEHTSNEMMKFSNKNENVLIYGSDPHALNFPFRIFARGF